MSFISGRTTDGVISEPARASRVSTVFPNMPNIKSYVESAADFYVTKPSSSFVLAPSDEYVRWRTSWGAAPSSCSLRSTMGSLAKLYGFEDKATWSPSCWDLSCPAPGEPAGSVADPWRPTKRAFQPYNADIPTYNSTGRCLSACATACSGPGDTTRCAAACTDRCLSPMGFGVGSTFQGHRSCNMACGRKCDGNPNFSECASRCADGCKSSDSYEYPFTLAGYSREDLCTDSCAQQCSASSDVNDCFIPCTAKCGAMARK